jgi:hypothetical protein
MRTTFNFTLATFLVLALPSAKGESFDWNRLRAGEWIRVPTTGVAAPKVFHGGATIAPGRSEVYFFGSDTHSPTSLEKGESNAVFRLNLEKLTWSQDYEQEPLTSYRILGDGQTVTAAGRPWAMHTFDAVEWDPTARRIVVVSHPAHTRFRPEKRFPFFKGDWFKRLKSSHWEYDPEARRWARLDTNAPPLFAHALTWDSDRKQLIGHDGARTYHFDRASRRWNTNEAATIPGWHLSMVFDSHAGKLLLLGNNGGSDVLFAYDPERRQWQRVPVKGSCLPANGATIAFDTHNQVMLYLANDYENQYNNPTGRSATFIYDSRRQGWARLTVESPELYGMNYLMQYDPVRRVFLHFEKTQDSADRIVVWAFRYR